MRWRLASRRVAAALLAAVAALAAAGATATPTGRAAVAAADLPAECPPVMPVEEITAGMTGTGLSVVQGRDPASFDVEVLGILRDAPLPGRNIIIAELSGPVIDAAGGVWFGASGSPVYLPDPVTAEQELAGAVAYGFAFGSSTIAGLTAAEDMVDLLDPSSEATAAPESVRVPAALRARVATRAGLSATELSTTLERLKTPLSVSGISDRGLARVRQAITRQNLPFVPYVGSSASAAASAEPAELVAGSSFAAALSLGDITTAGVGTTTLVCYDQAVAFGHPFTWTGETTLAARAADTITIVKDPIFGGFKMANVAENAGVVGVDRLAGIAATLGEGPATTPVTTDVTDLASGRTRSGQSDNVLPGFLGFLTFIHMLTNIDATIDRVGPGNAEVHYRITGTNAASEAWELARTNHFASPWDISFESVLETADNVELLHSFEAEGVDITGVEVSKIDVESAFEQYQLRRVLVWNGSSYVLRDFVQARPGETVLLRAVLRPAHATGTRNVDLALKVPTWAKRSGYIEVRGGADTRPSLPCFFDGEECGEDGETTFEAVLGELQRQPRGDELLARLRLGPRERVRATANQTLDAVVRGSRVIGFELIGGRCCFGGRAVR